MMDDLSEFLRELVAAGVDFDCAWADRTEGNIIGVHVPVLGRKAFIMNKRATGRTKDLADIESLGEVD